MKGEIILARLKMFAINLNQDAAKAMASGRKAGIDITPAIAIQWITMNPAKSMGIDHLTGSVEAGKAAEYEAASKS